MLNATSCVFWRRPECALEPIAYLIPMLSQSPEELSWNEISESRRELESALGEKVWAMAYPFGDPASVTRRELEMAERAGYKCAFLNFGGGFGAQTARFAWPRVHVMGNITLPEFEAHVSGFYGGCVRASWARKPARGWAVESIAMSARQGGDNLRVYNAPEVASHYAALDYLTPCENFLFSTYIRAGAAILDLGVGGGRTTPYLSGTASRYAGLDYSEKMIRLCRERFPQLEFRVSDASDLSTFEDASFDAVVMAFNVLDYVLPAEKRRLCLRECRRVLRTGGLLIFSSHNPRAVLIYPAWDREKLRGIGRKLVSDASVFFPAAILMLTVVKWLHSWLRAAGGSAARVIRRCFKLAFWHGEGCMVDPVHGGLVTHYWIPTRAVAELGQCGFHMVRCMGDDYPRASRLWVTDWYYYVFQKTDRVAAGSPCV